MLIKNREEQGFLKIMDPTSPAAIMIGEAVR